MRSQMQRPRIPWLVACLVFVLVSACGAEAATEFSGANDEAFLAACMETGVDGLLQQRVCRCVLEEAQTNMAYERFVEINGVLATDPDAAMPDDLLALVAACVVEEGDL